ncbi:MAG: sulfatase [Akkermansiaceae bacterium]|nr:sulfatase [Akkermansiaceae bacterium]
MSFLPSLRCLKSACLLLVWSVAIPASGAVSKPNIVFFMVDDMGWQDSSVPFHSERTPFNDFFRTPAMERLAASGVRLTQAYSCAVCTPTRVSWFTGRNATRHHITNWTLKGETSGKSPQLLPPAWKKEGLQPGDAPTAAELLRKAGYRTIHIGKAHWGAVGTDGADPLKLGFDVNIAGHAAGAPGSFQGLERYGEGQPGKEIWAVPGLADSKGKDIHLTDALTTEACREMESCVKGNKQPFFLYLSHYAVHTPLQPHRPYLENYQKQAVAESEKLYASMVEGMDASLGRVLDKLKELEIADETLVVFYTDNGGLSHAVRGKDILGTAALTHNLPLREGKGSAYEGGIRVPAIITWAENNPASDLQKKVPITANSRLAKPVMIEDLFPTFLNWAGVASPDSPIDGEDISPALTNPSETRRKASIFWHFPNVWTPYPADRHVGYQPHSTIRSGDWKAIYFHEPQTWELYDLGKDPGETRNLAQSEFPRLTQLARELSDRLNEMKSPLPVDRATGKPRPLRLPSETPPP